MRALSNANARLAELQAAEAVLLKDLGRVRSAKERVTQFIDMYRLFDEPDQEEVGSASSSATPSETHERASTNDEASPEAGPQAEASPAGTGTGTLADREARHEGEAAPAALPTHSPERAPEKADDAPPAGEAPASPAPKAPTLRSRIEADLASHPNSTTREIADRLDIEHPKVSSIVAQNKLPVRKLTPEERRAAQSGKPLPSPVAAEPPAPEPIGVKAKAGDSPWTPDAVETLRRMAAEGATAEEITKVLNERPRVIPTVPRGVRRKATDLGIDLATPDLRSEAEGKQRHSSATAHAERIEQLKQEARERLGEPVAKPKSEPKLEAPRAEAKAPVASPFTPVGGDEPRKIKRGPKGTQYRLRQGRGEGKYLHQSCIGLVPGKSYSWMGSEAQLQAVRQKFPETIDLIEEVVEKEGARA